MDELNLITINAIEKYYSHLDNLGYADNDDMYAVLAISFIDDILDMFNQYITNADYNTILKTVLCLSSKSCLISSPHFLTQESLFKDSNYYKLKMFRISEDSLFRFNEDGTTKVALQ